MDSYLHRCTSTLLRCPALVRPHANSCPRWQATSPHPSVLSFLAVPTHVTQFPDILTPEFGDAQPFADWLTAAGCSVADLLASTPGEAKPLPAPRRMAYRRKVILGTFVAEWVRRNRAKPWQSLVCTDEGRLFQMAIILV